MRTFVKATALLIIVLVIGGCTPQKRKLDLPNIMLTTDNLIPHPLEVTATNGSFLLDNYTAIITSDDEDLKDIFQLFATTNNLDRLGNKGNGIGLSTVKKLVTKLKGDLKVTSVMGEGTTIEFSIQKG